MPIVVRFSWPGKTIVASGNGASFSRMLRRIDVPALGLRQARDDGRDEERVDALGLLGFVVLERGELVSCFLLRIEDNMESIARGINSALQLSKRGGGVALQLTNLRNHLESLLNEVGNDAN